METAAKFVEGINYDAIPVQRMRDGVERYIRGHVEPGKFLRAVISNDLREAIGQADAENFAHLREWVQWFHWEAPGSCHGSAAAMQRWLAQGELIR